MTLDAHSEAVAEWLRAMAYLVDPIPETNEESADLWARQGGYGLVVEIKSRIEDCAVAEELDAAPIGTIVEYEGNVERDETIGRIVRKAVGQIEASQRTYEGLGVLWFRPEPILRDLDAAEKMWATLVGARIIGYGPRLEDFKFGTCLFATHSSFHRYHSLDAAVINADEKATLLVNPFGRKKDQLRESHLYNQFSEAVMDLDVVAPPQGMFVLHSDVDRGDPAAVHAALRAQHPKLKFVFASTSSYANYTCVQLPRGATRTNH